MRNTPLFRQDLRLVLDAQALDWSLFLKHYANAVQSVHSIQGAIQRFSFIEYLWSNATFVESLAEQFQKFRTILIVGRADDIAGTKYITHWVQSFLGQHDSSFPEVHFLSAPDPELFWEIMGTVNLEHTGVMIVASTPEDMFPYIILLRCIEAWQSSVKKCTLHHHIAVWLPKNMLIPHIHTVAQQFDLTVHQYSILFPKSSYCFNELSLTVGKLIGLHIQLFLGGAKKTCWQYFHQILKSPLEGAALCTTLSQQYPHLVHWIWTATQSFHPLGQWVQWLWEETIRPRVHTLPRHVMHTPPMRYSALSTTFWEKKNITDIAFPGYFDAERVPYTSVHLKQLLDQEFKKECRHLAKEGQPVRIFYTKQLNEETLGALSAHFLLEVSTLMMMHEPQNHIS